MAQKKIRSIININPSEKKESSPKPTLVGKENKILKRPNGKSATDIIQELGVVDDTLERFEKRRNILLRDLRSKTGKSFRHQGRTFQIRQRGDKLFLAEMGSSLRDLAEEKKKIA